MASAQNGAPQHAVQPVSLGGSETGGGLDAGLRRLPGQFLVVMVARVVQSPTKVRMTPTCWSNWRMGVSLVSPGSWLGDGSTTSDVPNSPDLHVIFGYLEVADVWEAPVCPAVQLPS